MGDASLPGPVGRRSRRPPALRLYLAAVTVWVVAAIVGGLIVVDGAPGLALRLSPWIVALFLAEMLPIPLWRTVRISLGYPLLVLLACLYGPVVVGTLAFLGTGDPREFRGGSDLLRSLFNRAQVAAAGMAASAAFHALEPRDLGPLALVAVAAASLAHMLVNTTLVAAAARLDYGGSTAEVIRRLVIGGRWSLQVAYATVGILGGLMALVVREMGAWALGGVAAPLLALRHLLVTSRAIEREEARLRHEAERRAGERQREEDRRRHLQEVAAFLHDEIVPELTAAGLLMESAGRGGWEGPPESREQMRSAAATAQTARLRVRSLIGDLLRGQRPRDLDRSLRHLAAELEEEHAISVRLRIEAVELGWAEQEVLFGVARESARNAARHGAADVVEISVREDGDHATMTVADDGSGFDAARASTNGGGYGVRIMRRRVETLGGRLSIVSASGRGTVVTCELPLARESEASAASSAE